MIIIVQFKFWIIWLFQSSDDNDNLAFTWKAGKQTSKLFQWQIWYLSPLPIPSFHQSEKESQSLTFDFSWHISKSFSRWRRCARFRCLFQTRRRKDSLSIATGTLNSRKSVDQPLASFCQQIVSYLPLPGMNQCLSTMEPFGLHSKTHFGRCSSTEQGSWVHLPMRKAYLCLQCWFGRIF